MNRIEYQLTFENFQEMTQGRLKKPRLRPSAIAALMGMSLMAVGYTCIQILPEAKIVVGGVIFTAGVLAMGIAVVLGFAAKPRASRMEAVRLRSEYEGYYADKRTIEFDERGWRLFWYEGEDVRPWSCLTAIYNQETLLVLTTETTNYWLPKATLEKHGQLEILSALAQAALKGDGKLFSVAMRPSLASYIGTHFFDNWNRNLKRNLLLHCGAILLAYWLLFTLWSDGAPSFMWFVLLVPLSALACEALHYARIYAMSKWSEGPLEAGIMGDRIHYKTARMEWVARYRRLQKWKEFRSAFLLYFEPHSFHLIPKKGLSPDQIVQFRKLISQEK
jgi:YcxB-like protein